MSMTFCTVCKLERFSDDQKLASRKKRWAFTSERTSVSQVQIIFKLYEILKHEFLAGSVCDECFSLLDQIDSLEFQVQAMTKALKSRIDLVMKQIRMLHSFFITMLKQKYLIFFYKKTFIFRVSTMDL